MISSLKNNYSPFLSNKTNYNTIKAKNEYSTGRDILNFSGKDFVPQKIFGEIIQIPKAVNEAKRYSRYIMGFKKGQSKYTVGNVVSLGEKDIYLGVKHIDMFNKDKIEIGRFYFNKNTAQSVSANIVKLPTNEDLAIYKTNTLFSDVLKDSKLEPLKIASSMPTAGDTVYIIGSNRSIGSKKAIPATVSSKCELANHCKIYSKTLEKNKDRFYGTGLSGAPVFNNNGEFVGILYGGYEDAQHIMFFIDINTIKKFLDENKTKIRIAKNIPCFSTLKKKFSKLSPFKE